MPSSSAVSSVWAVGEGGVGAASSASVSVCVVRREAAEKAGRSFSRQKCGCWYLCFTVLRGANLK